MSETGYVYTLDDPRTDNPKYVGATTNPTQRFGAHLSEPSNPDVENWLAELDSSGLTPEMTIIAVVGTDELADKESELIEELSEEYELFNIRGDTQDHWGDDGSGWGYVKANVPDSTHRWIRTEAKKYDMKVEEIAGQLLQETCGEVLEDGTVVDSNGEIK